MGNTAKKKIEKKISEEDVISFLEDNSSFLLFHEELAEKLEIPVKEQENVISLGDFQTERWKKRAERLEKQNELLVKTSLFNLESEALLRDVIVEIMQSVNVEGLVDILQVHLKDGMNLDNVELYLTKKEGNINRIDKAEVNTLFEEGTSVKLRTIYETEDATIHRGMEKDIASDAILKLEVGDKCYGILALGSLDQTRFHAGQGSELLSFFGKILAVHVKRLVG
jgi:uncharacterized protein YigA (DUF484 family)